MPNTVLGTGKRAANEKDTPDLGSTVERQAVSLGHNAVAVYGEVRYRVDSYYIFFYYTPRSLTKFFVFSHTVSRGGSQGLLDTTRAQTASPCLLKKTKEVRDGPMIQAQ